LGELGPREGKGGGVKNSDHQWGDGGNGGDDLKEEPKKKEISYSSQLVMTSERRSKHGPGGKHLRDILRHERKARDYLLQNPIETRVQHKWQTMIMKHRKG